MTTYSTEPIICGSMATEVDECKQSLLERKRLLSLPPMSRFYVLATKMSVEGTSNSLSPSSNHGEYIPSPPTPPSSKHRQRGCRSTYRFSEETMLLRKGVGFGDRVKVHFYEGGGDGIVQWDVRFATVKKFDGRSDSNRGKLFEDNIDEFVAMMSVCSNNWGDNGDEGDDTEGMALDFFTSSFTGGCPRRSRAYADSDWISEPVATTTAAGEDLDLLWYMENTPCDMDMEATAAATC